MELSSNTIELLKNFAAINPNIVIGAGSELKTMSVARNIVAKANIEETFPSTFGIYDLNEFLSVINLVDSPQLKFSDNYVTVAAGSGLSSVRYYFSDPDMLTAPQKEIIMPATEVKFLLNTETLNRIKRAASALGHSEISIKPSGGSIELSVVDSKDATSNSFAIVTEGDYEEGVDFNFILNVSNLKVVAEDFEVGISSKLISQFKSTKGDTEYFIALEKTSTYGA